MKESAVQHKVKRYLIFLIGLFVNSLGVALITKANLGTSPISSIPYVLSLSFPFSLGEFTIAFSILLILLQVVILGRNFRAEHLLQIPVSLVFGYFIDLCMLLFFFVQPTVYVLKVVYLLIGCVVLGAGVYMEVLANVIMLPGESFVRAVVFRWKTEFGVTKVAFDVSMAVIAAVLGIVLTGHLNGVREGTVIAALLVGFIARLIGKKLAFLPEKLFGPAQTAPQPAEEQPICIAIGRQFGSGGHDIAHKLAERLGYVFYDEELIQLAAGTTGYEPAYIAKNEEKHSLLYDLVNEGYSYSEQGRSPKDVIFQAEAAGIREAARQNSVIVGRCADWILRDHPRCLRVFLHAPLDYRVQTVMKREQMHDAKAAQHHIQQTDKQRADNYHYYTHTTWGASANYHVSIDTSLGADYVEELLVGLVARMKSDVG